MPMTGYPDLFLVIANRKGDRNNHSYPVGVFRTENMAENEARKEEKNRAGKYICEIWTVKLDSPIFDSSEEQQREEP